jgi:hypothetical protein
LLPSQELETVHLIPLKIMETGKRPVRSSSRTIGIKPPSRCLPSADRVMKRANYSHLESKFATF